jgi:uncharacterized protein YrrD
MVRAGEVIGRPIVEREGGKRLGKVKDLVVDPTGRRVIGLIVSEGPLRSTKVASWAALQVMGRDSIVLNSAGSVVKAADAPEIKRVLDQESRIRGLRLQTTEGKGLGKIEDFRFDEQTGVLEGFELSGGLFADAYAGRSFLPIPPSIELGKDVGFVDPEAEATIQQSGGLKGAFKRSD